MRYITAQEMQELDRRAIKEFGIPAIILMENAGQKASEVALDMLPDKKKQRVVCICGKGNNGGDGFVCCRHLINNNIDTDIFLIGNPSELKGNAKINYKILNNLGKTIRILKNRNDLVSLKSKLKKAHLIIDAIFGIGLSGRVKEPYRSIINLINQAQQPILAIDVPSGLDATAGNVLGVCVRAAKTVTFASPKRGFAKNDGPLYVGELIIVDISIPGVLLTQGRI